MPMAVFDNGGFSDRVRKDKLKRIPSSSNEWNEGYKYGLRVGYDNGYKAALDRYIPVDREAMPKA